MCGLSSIPDRSVPPSCPPVWLSSPSCRLWSWRTRIVRYSPPPVWRHQIEVCEPWFSLHRDGLEPSGPGGGAVRRDSVAYWLKSGHAEGWTAGGEGCSRPEAAGLVAGIDGTAGFAATQTSGRICVAAGLLVRGVEDSERRSWHGFKLMAGHLETGVCRR